jgi:peptidoglycan/LPS O-acetylase OafA/YrhL
LDGLRAIAIGLVVARHSLRPFISEDAYAPVAAWGGLDLTPLLMNGWVGVDLFFVLSGFLIGRQAFRGEPWTRFWFRRVTRIFPAYLTCLAVVAAGLTLSGGWSAHAGDFAAHLVMLQDYTGSAFVPAFWSLGAEEKFYLLAPVLAVSIGRVPSRLVQGGGLALLWALPIAARVLAAHDMVAPISYLDHFARYRSPFHLTSESLVLGFAIAWASLHLRPELLSGRGRNVIFCGTAGALALWLAAAPLLINIGPATVIAVPAVVGVAFGALVLACVSGEGVYSRVLRWDAWRPLARVSFSLYLVHMMVIPSAMSLARGMWPASPPSLTAQWLLFLGPYLLLSGLATWLLHSWVERRVLVWRDRYLAAHAAGAAPPRRLSTITVDSSRLTVHGPQSTVHGCPP